MIQYLRKRMDEDDLSKVAMLGMDEKMELATELLQNTSATPDHVGKFLHMKIKKAVNDNSLTHSNLPEVFAANGEQGEAIRY